VGTLRHILLRHRGLAAILLALTLCLKVLVPSGMMVGGGGDRILAITICADSMGQQIVRHMIVPGRSDGAAGKTAAKGECPFTALSLGATGAVDAALLALALAFVMALAFAPVAAIPLRSARRFWPPLRGPPLLG
jgi:hypothetical protein